MGLRGVGLLPLGIGSYSLVHCDGAFWSAVLATATDDAEHAQCDQRI